MTSARCFGASLLVAASLFVAAACEASRYGHVEIHRVGGHPDAEIGPGGFVVPEGGVIVFEAQPLSDAGSPAYVGLERFKLRPSDPDVAMAHRAILRDTWVVSGLSLGRTELQVIVDGDVVDDVAVEIVPVELEDAP
jgi:hypothetical protein